MCLNENDPNSFQFLFLSSFSVNILVFYLTQQLFQNFYTSLSTKDLDASSTLTY